MARPARVTLGFSTHTGWAALVAAAGVEVLGRARVSMIEGHVPEEPPYVYHAARRFEPAEAERFVRAAAVESRRAARAAIAAAVKQHGARAAGIVVGNRPVTAAFAAILANHSLIHAAEGELYRDAIRAACEALELRVVEIRAEELEAVAAARPGVAPARLPERLAEVGRAAGKPWGKDQKQAFLAALCAQGSSPGS